MQVLTDMLRLCHLLSAPVKLEKVVSPVTTLLDLGIKLSSLAGQACLSAEKLHILLEKLCSFQQIATEHGTCTKCQLLSLVGKLAFSYKVIPTECIFLRCLLNTAHLLNGLHSTIVTDDDTVQDITQRQPCSHIHTCQDKLGLPLP